LINRNTIIKNTKNEAEKLREKVDGKTATFEEIKSCVSNDLIAYIKHRQNIIDKLKEMNNNKESLEKNIHNLLLQKGSEGDEFSPVELDKNNLWLLGDKFMSYNYIASEKAISTFLKQNNLEYIKSSRNGYCFIF
jgi:hypothetical protein